MKRFASAVALLILFLAGPASAHQAGVSQTRLEIEGARIAGEFELHYDDALALLGLPAGGEADAAWAAIAAHEDSLRRALAGRLAIADTTGPCPLRVLPAPLRRNVEQGTVVLAFEAGCPAEPTRLTLTYEVLFDVDPRHRGYFSVRDSRMTHVGVFRSSERVVTFDVHRFRLWGTIAEFTREGMRHIWTGLDHVLFLLALLLPSALVRDGGTWTPRPGFRRTLGEVLKIVTAFTLAHSLTLALTWFRVFVPPVRWVESAIALSVFVAAWNNLRPFLPGRAWVLAATFGLVHGMGFAGALGALALPRQARGLALGTFNVGVEIGQVAIVALALPLIYAASRRTFYPRAVMGVGSLVIAWVAAMWTIGRATGIAFLP